MQLPPMEGKEILKPDAFLTEIHRQALESGIIRVSMMVRDGRRPRLGECIGEDFQYLRRSEVSPERFLQADQIITGFRSTRSYINAWIREIKGLKGILPLKGERIICVKNNNKLGLHNGMQLMAREDCDIDEYDSGVFTVYLEGFPVGIKAWMPDFEGGEDKWDHYDNQKYWGLDRFNFAYAITCHKSQGSEYDDLIVIDEPIGEGDRAMRWLYTAVTRAKKNCILRERKNK